MAAAGPKFGVFSWSGETPSAGPTHHGPPDGALYDAPEEGPPRAGRGEGGVQHGDGVPDPLAGIFAEEIVPLLEASPGLRAVALYEEMMRRHPHLHSGVRRTIERRVRPWKAKHGPEQEIIFRQRHEPGRRGLSDFTDAMGLEVTVAGEPLAHKLYHFRLEYSGFCHAAVVLGGEELRCAGRGAAGRAVGSGWRAEGAPNRQPVGGLPEPETGRAGGPDCALRGAAGGLRDGGEPQQPGRGPRERVDRGPARAPEAGDRGCAAAEGLAGLRDDRGVPGVRGRRW